MLDLDRFGEDTWVDEGKMRLAVESILNGKYPNPTEDERYFLLFANAKLNADISVLFNNAGSLEEKLLFSPFIIRSSFYENRF